jgi:hypothetical protein
MLSDRRVDSKAWAGSKKLGIVRFSLGLRKRILYCQSTTYPKSVFSVLDVTTIPVLLGTSRFDIACNESSVILIRRRAQFKQTQESE